MIPQLVKNQVVEDVSGIKIIKLDEDSGLIIGVDFSHGLGHVYQLGQVVHSNGRIFAPKGTPGIIVKIHRPGASGRTNNILEVHFQGSRFTEFMKAKDLEIEG